MSPELKLSCMSPELQNDKQDFLKRLSRVLTKTQTPCYAYAIMSNHFHVLLQTGSRSIIGEWNQDNYAPEMPEANEPADERILGKGEFVEAALEYAEEQESHRSKLKREGWDFTKVLEKAAETVGLESEELLRRGRSNARSYGRALLCKWMIQDLGYTQKEIAGKLGVNRSSISRMAQKGAKAEKTFKVTL
jgi:hypothetical protein